MSGILDNLIKHHIEINKKIDIAFGKASARIKTLEEENRKLREERDSHAPEGRNYTNGQYVALLLKYESAQQEKEKLIEGLRDLLDYESPSNTWEYVQISIPKILKEIGVRAE